MIDDHDTLAPGTVVAERYRIERLIARGGMGAVYEAVQIPLERAVALKVLHRALLSRPGARARFEREARVASALPHPSTVAIHDFGALPDRAFLAMELIQGPTLRARIDANPTGLGVEPILRVAGALADVLHAAHDAALVHRDLTPSNVILEPTEAGERVRVLDFGLAFLLEHDALGRMTREGVAMGTPAYLSPEQARGGEVGPPTDVYALGCVLHELLTGAPPFVGSEMDVITKQLFAPAPPLTRADGAPVPVELDALRRAMLEKRPERRPTAREVHDRLAALDPDPGRERARSRQEGFLGARARRMVDAAAAPAPVVEHEIEVGVLGEVEASLVLGLRANGIAAFPIQLDEPLGETTRAVYAPRATAEVLAALRRFGVPVISDADRGDLERLSTLMSAGAADVVLRPATAAELARKLIRVARRADR